MRKFLRFSITCLCICLLAGMLIWIVSQNETEPALANPSLPESELLVNTLDDELNGDGDCSLREAVTAANENVAVDGCPAGDSTSTDTIMFDVFGVITVTSQLSMTAGGPLVIDGGDAITISGGGTTRISWVDVGSKVSLSHLAMVNGNSEEGGSLYNNQGYVAIMDATFSGNEGGEGGAIYNFGSIDIRNTAFDSNHGGAVAGSILNDGQMTISNSDFINNSSYFSSGAIDNWGTLTITDCTFTGNSTLGDGGAIYGADIMITRSTFDGNSANLGGGIYAGNVTIIDSTFSGNTADKGGGILGGYGGEGDVTIINSTISGNTARFGGGFYNDGISTITNSTISGNSATSLGGGIISVYTYSPSTLLLAYSTISDNSAVEGGGIYVIGNVTLASTIVANSPSGGDCLVNAGTLVDGGHSLDSDGSCGLDPANGSLPATDPLLGPLQDNGGATFTLALQPGSPAIDAGENDGCPGTDQRGMLRPLDGDGDGVATCDIGSYETGGSILEVNTLEDELNSDGDCSLREAIEAANTNSAVDSCGAGNSLLDMVTFDVEGTINLAASGLTVMDAGKLVIDGSDAITISGSMELQVMQVQPDAILSLRRLAIINGDFSGDGGGVYNAGSLILTNSSLIENQGGNGGGIYNAGELVIDNSTFSGNSASEGSGIYNSGILEIKNATFSENSAIIGGGVSNWGTLVITGSTFSANYAEDWGAGINNWGSMTIFNSTIADNGIGVGSGIYASETGTTTLVNTIVAQNQNQDCFGVITDGGHNLDSDGTCSLDPAMGSLPVTDPLLGPLQDNGGPTLTYALLAESPAIDAGENAGCTSTDQRGFFRPLDGNGDRIAVCDIGSYEGYYGFLLVNTLQDELVADGNCSLREALQAANTNLPVDGCGAGEILPDQIIFGVEGTITLGSQLAVLGGGPLIVDGGGNIATSGGGITRVWKVEQGSDFTLLNLTVRDGAITGDYAAGLDNDHGKVAITDCTFTNNVTSDYTGGAVSNRGVISITGSTFYSNTVWWNSGAAVDNEYEGFMIIKDSTLTGNHAYSGGSIYNGGVLTITNSVVYGNDSYWNGGGMLNNGTASIINSTISGNSISQGEGGGVENNLGSMSIINTTITGNTAPAGGGINGSILGINTIIANNTGGDCHDPINDAGHNLDSDGSCGLNPANGSLPNTDPLLGPLQDNGGPTWTHALLEGSPAIDAGDDSLCPTTDQRGVPRPLDGNGDGIAACDIGAYELRIVSNFYLPVIHRD